MKIFWFNAPAKYGNRHLWSKTLRLPHKTRWDYTQDIQANMVTKHENVLTNASQCFFLHSVVFRCGFSAVGNRFFVTKKCKCWHSTVFRDVCVFFLCDATREDQKALLSYRVGWICSVHNWILKKGDFDVWVSTDVFMARTKLRGVFLYIIIFYLNACMDNVWCL